MATDARHAAHPVRRDGRARIGRPPVQVDCLAGGNLQDAINEAAPGSTLLISDTCTGDFTIDKDLRVKGKQGTNPTLNGTGGFGKTVLDIGRSNPSAAVTVKDLVITNAGCCGGNGIRNSSTLALQGVTVSGNHGSVGIGNIGTLTVKASTVSHNAGWGISTAQRGVTTVNNSVIEHNGTRGVSNSQDSILTVTNSSINDNRGRGIHNDSAILVLKDSEIRRNETRGIFNSNGEVSITKLTMSENMDGGIQNITGKVLIVDSFIKDNVSSSNFGGGIVSVHGGDDQLLTLIRTEVSGNTTTLRDGGGLALFVSVEGLSVISLSDSTVTGNTAVMGMGGGIFADTFLVVPTITLTNTTVSGNFPDDCVGLTC